MGFEQDPDYEFLRGLFKQVMAVHNFQFDSDFDWISRTISQVKSLWNISLILIHLGEEQWSWFE